MNPTGIVNVFEPGLVFYTSTSIIVLLIICIIGKQLMNARNDGSGQIASRALDVILLPLLICFIIMIGLKIVEILNLL